MAVTLGWRSLFIFVSWKEGGWKEGDRFLSSNSYIILISPEVLQSLMEAISDES